MTSGDKAVLGIFGGFALLCAIAFFIPGFRDIELSRGVFGALHLPIWGLAIIGFAISVVVVAFGLWMHRRRKKGLPPL
jgi:membrane protein implicated in regulation of membrane protease activity